MVPPDFTDQSSSKANCSVPTALPQLPPPFVIRGYRLLTHVGLIVKCLSSLTCKHVILAIRLTTLSNKNSSYPTSEYLPPICLISEYGNLFRYSYPLTQESRPQLLGSLSPGVSQTIPWGIPYCLPPPTALCDFIPNVLSLLIDFLFLIFMV